VGGHPHGDLNWPIRIAWREIRIGGWRGLHEAREAQGVIRREELSFWDSFIHLANKISSLFTLLFNLVNRLFSHESLKQEIQPLLRGTIHACPREAVLQQFQEFRGSDIAPPPNTRQPENTEREIEASRDQIVGQRVSELR